MDKVDYRIDECEEIKSVEDLRNSRLYGRLGYDMKEAVLSTVRERNELEIGLFHFFYSKDEYTVTGQNGFYVFVPEAGRMGIAVGVPEWADVNSKEEGLDLYLNDRESYRDRM
jgi:hypothetical protein